MPRRRPVIAALVLAAFAGCSTEGKVTVTGPSAATVTTTPTRRSTFTSAPATTTPTTVVAVLPANCSTPASLPPLSATPKFPNGYQILNDAPDALAAQYPTVYGGVMIAPARPGQTMAETNSHFVILETVHDPYLEAEAKAAYPAPLTVQFQLVARTDRCLKGLMETVSKAMPSAVAAGITPTSWGPDAARGQISVGVTACGGSDVARAVGWFAARWGNAVAVSACQQVATAK